LSAEAARASRSKRSKRHRVGGDVLGQEFQRDGPAESQVLGLVHDSHAAASQDFEDSIVREDLSWQQRGGACSFVSERFLREPRSQGVSENAVRCGAVLQQREDFLCQRRIA
jgi:hypothetical protein